MAALARTIVNRAEEVEVATLPDRLVEHDPAVLAPSVGLRHIVDDEPGISRRRRGAGFSYHAPDGTLLQGRARERCEALAIPPAWTDVWIAPRADGYLQASGRDDAGRKQHRYHDDYRALCERRKFQRLAWFGAALDDLRAAVQEGLDADDPTTRAHATVLRLIDRSLIRVGGPAHSEVTGAQGAVSLGPDNVEVDGEVVHISYVAKGGNEREVDVTDAELADALTAQLAEDEDRLFRFVDEECPREVTARSVNAWILDCCRSPFTARDFRTWGGTVTAADTLLDCNGDPRPDLRAADAAAERLGNTRTVARDAYVAPAVVAAHDEGRLQEIHGRTRRGRWLSRTERTVMRVLQEWADA